MPTREHSALLRPCLLLDEDENAMLMNLIPDDCQGIYWTVCQVWTTDEPSHRQWNKFSTGVVSLLKDFTCRSFFICLFDLTFDDGVLLWKQELYPEMEYVQITNFAHTFEADNCMVALNFADEEDAQQFYRHVTQKLIALRKKISDSTAVRPADNAALPPASTETFSANSSEALKLDHSHDASSYLLGVQAPFFRSTTSPVISGKNTYRIKSKDKKTNKLLTKIDISMPTDFRHVSHIGWDINRGLSFDEHDPLVLELLRKAGIDVKGKDANEKEFIYGFIQESLGGVAELRRQKTIKADRQRPRKTSPMPPPRSSSKMPLTEPLLDELPPPPLPPPLLQYDDYEEISEDELYESFPPPTTAPPPPPLPPLRSPKTPTARTALMDDITKGVTLIKSASENVLAQPRPLSDRDKLMSDIRTTRTLKPVEVEATASRIPVKEDVGLESMAQVLSRALAQRREAIALRDHDGDKSEDEDEWDA